MTNTQLLELAKSQGLKNIKINETEKEFNLTFLMISKINKMNKIGKIFQNEFGSKNVGWTGNWIAIIK